MGKKQGRKAAAKAKDPTAVEHRDESNAVIGEYEMMRDEVDEHLLQRDQIRFDTDSDQSEDSELGTEEVLQLPSDQEEESDEDSGEELKERHLEEVEDELRATDKAWGRKKAVYYGQHDDESELSSAAEGEMDEEEEREAMVLQNRLMSHLSHKDFDTARFVTESEEQPDARVVKTDMSSMTKDEKLMFLLQDSPELPELLEEFREKLSEAGETLYPLVEMGRQKGTFSRTGHSYIEAKYKLNLLYSLNIGFYLMLQSSKENKAEVKSHPVIQRIVALRKMFKDCATTDVTLEREIEHLLQVDESAPRNNKRRIWLEEEEEEEEEDFYEKHRALAEEKKNKRKKKKNKGIEILREDPALMTEGEDKRGITYKIMKNKGLTPHRKKEQRNPRVKHRMKFAKALKKRRSQVPDMRTHEGMYGGEKSGIKSGLTKGTKLK